jgi:acyl-coenzyme A thioesterase PaaI-like protein
MTTIYSKLMQNVHGGSGGVTLDIPEDWMQGRTAFGGLQAALALRAMRALVPDVPLRTLQATFVAPVPGGITRARAHVLRSGKSATQVEARIADGDTTLALMVGVFGAARASAVTVVPNWQPVDSTRAIAFRYVPGVFPAFTQHFIVRWLRGRPPSSGDDATDNVVEISLRDEGNATEAHVLAIADFMPPVAMSHFEAAPPGSTLTWMLEFLVERVDHLPLEGWRLDAQLVAARDGYTSQSVTIWGPGGEPVALSKQSMVVFG